MPQSHEPGAEAEVDFAELYVDLEGCRTKVILFTLRYPTPGARSIGCSAPPEARKRASRATFTRSSASVGCGGTHPLRQPQVRGLMGVVRPRPPRVRSLGGVPLHYGFDAFYGHPGVEAPTRRAVWRARAAGAITRIFVRRRSRGSSSVRQRGSPGDLAGTGLGPNATRPQARLGRGWQRRREASDR